ncbi:MAG TPA: hypothetical protein VHU80_16875 [Polyangiaceae bacterium]|jgi:hypothetical protein|nr:hypothetical protein [Polyangiaceae bacterium]
MFHSPNPTLFGRPDGVLTETEALWRTVAGLRGVAAALAGSASQVTIEARRLLANFSTNLAAYFNVKEAGGYFGAIVAERPDLEKRVTALTRGRAELKDSVTSVRRLSFRTADRMELGRRIGGVVEGFEKHEQSENELLQTFFLDQERVDSHCEAP